METKLAIATALVGSMLVWGSAQATPASVLKSNPSPGIVTLVGGHSHGGGGGGPGGGLALRGGGGNGGSMSHINRGPVSRGNYALNNSGSIYRGNSGPKNRGSYAYKDHSYKDHGYKDHGNKHYAMKDHDHDHDHGNIHNRHRVFRNGVWVWGYGPDYTAYGDDCGWLRRQAIITGSPYWWSRYNACGGYDYY